MSFPKVHYQKEQRYYISPYGAPTVPTSFKSRQECRIYYDRVKSHIQLHHNGTWQHCEKMLYQYVYESHQKYFFDLIKRFSNGHKGTWCTGCFKCGAEQFWYNFQRAAHRASRRYPDLPDFLSPENTIERVSRTLEAKDHITDPEKFLLENLEKLQSALRHWPGALTMTIGMLTAHLPGLDRILMKKLAGERIVINEEGELSIPYHVNTLDVMRRVLEVVMSNAGALWEAHCYTEDISSSLQSMDLEEKPSLLSVKSSIHQDTQKPTCLFCGSSLNGHILVNCTLVECLAESGAIRFGHDGSICDYNGERIPFDSVPWCSSNIFLTLLFNRP